MGLMDKNIDMLILIRNSLIHEPFLASMSREISPIAHYSNLQALTEKYPILKNTRKNPVFRKPNL